MVPVGARSVSLIRHAPESWSTVAARSPRHPLRRPLRFGGGRDWGRAVGGGGGRQPQEGLLQAGGSRDEAPQRPAVFGGEVADHVGGTGGALHLQVVAAGADLQPGGGQGGADRFAVVAELDREARLGGAGDR